MIYRLVYYNQNDQPSTSTKSKNIHPLETNKHLAFIEIHPKAVQRDSEQST